ncbi:MAG: Mov34/MPN/PAD-1 family protein [Thermoproteota archaeon]
MVEACVSRDVVEGILAYSRHMHPKEAILVLRGKVDFKKGRIDILELVIPPRATQAVGFSAFPLQPLPLDMSVVGVAHSHPSGIQEPSVADLNNFYGGVMAICSYPYEDAGDISIYDGKGRKIPFRVRERQE